MAPLTPMDIYRLLDRSNCGRCGQPTCMAFSLAVVGGTANPSACPVLDSETAESISGQAGKRLSEEGFQSSVIALRKEFSELDLPSIAASRGARTGKDGGITIECLGRDFTLDKDGMMESRCHVNTWMETLLMSYCTGKGGGSLSGQWVNFGRLEGAVTVEPYFRRRCEEPLAAIADSHGSIFFDLLGVFGAEKAEGFDSDISLVLRPLPKVPMVIKYNYPEDGMGSSLRVLFDPTATGYLKPEVITFMGRGLAEMFRKIIQKHEGCADWLLSL